MALVVPALVLGALVGPAVVPSDNPVTASIAAPTAEAWVPQWFRDWQTCIWGVGAPAGIVGAAPGTAKWWVAANKAGLLHKYKAHVRDACVRFIRS